MSRKGIEPQEQVNIRPFYTVFSPGCGLAGFLQEKLRRRIKSQEDAPIWARRQATCQTDFRVGTLE